jgi:hypothetical protein
MLPEQQTYTKAQWNLYKWEIKVKVIGGAISFHPSSFLSSYRPRLPLFQNRRAWKREKKDGGQRETKHWKKIQWLTPNPMGGDMRWERGQIMHKKMYFMAPFLFFSRLFWMFDPKSFRDYQKLSSEDLFLKTIFFKWFPPWKITKYAQNMCNYAHYWKIKGIWQNMHSKYSPRTGLAKKKKTFYAVYGDNVLSAFVKQSFCGKVWSSKFWSRISA